MLRNSAVYDLLHIEGLIEPRSMVRLLNEIRINYRVLCDLARPHVVTYLLFKKLFLKEERFAKIRVIAREVCVPVLSHSLIFKEIKE